MVVLELNDTASQRLWRHGRNQISVNILAHTDNPLYVRTSRWNLGSKCP